MCKENLFRLSSPTRTGVGVRRDVGGRRESEEGRGDVPSYMVSVQGFRSGRSGIHLQYRVRGFQSQESMFRDGEWGK